MDGKDTLLSIARSAPKKHGACLDTFVAYLSFARDARLLVFAADCEGGARETLMLERAELDLHNEVVLVGDAPGRTLRRLSRGNVALAVGKPLPVESAVTPLWFDLPIVALGETVTVMETVEACGIVADTFDARRIAALTRIVASDARVRAAMIGEGRRVRARYAPPAVAGAVLEQLRDSAEPAETPQPKEHRPMSRRLVVTGGLGFIGSAFVRLVLRERADISVTVLDAMTYAANPANVRSVANDPRYRFVRGDICDPAAVREAIGDGADAIVNFAAETHVDRSILAPEAFLRTDVLGTHVLLEAVREQKIARFLQVSTDEVYGDVEHGSSTEEHPLRPRSPYAASKPAAICRCSRTPLRSTRRY